MKWIPRFLLLLNLSLGAFSLYGEPLDELRVGKVEFIIENLPEEMQFTPQTLSARMHIKEGELFSQSEFDQDLKMLSEEYYLIEPTVEVLASHEVKITLHIWLKPKIHALCFSGNQNLSTKKLKKTLEIKEGEPFERDIFVKAFNKLKMLYIKKGYFESELSYEFVPLENGTQMDILIHINEGRAGKVKEIVFSGLDADEEDELLQLMLTKKYNLFLSWYTGRGIYHAEMMEHDRLQLLNFLQNKGYADARVSICLNQPEQSNRVELYISIEKGSLYTVGSLQLCGNSLFENHCIWELFDWGVGSVYSPENLRMIIQAIRDFYGKSGYIDVQVDVQIALREDAPVYDLIFTLDEGLCYYVGLVKVFGNIRTQTRVVLHETLLCPGEIFDNRKLAATEARLCNTGYFSAVNVYAVRSQLEDGSGERQYRDVYIEVEETDTGNMNLFCGFSSLDHLFGGVEITERNFNIAGLTRLFEVGPHALRGGGEFANARVNIGDKQTSYTLQWTKPYFLDTPWLVGVDLERTNNRVLSRAYTIKTYGGSLHATYVWNPYIKHDFHYRARHTHVDVVDAGNPLLNREGQQGGFISAVGASLIYDSTDHPRRASCGLRSRLTYELAGLGGNYQFMKFSYLNSYYYPFGPRTTLKFRAEAQFIKTYATTAREDIPLSERFFLGGETTVRGYRPFIIGPKFGNNEPRGGMSSLLFSEELQYNLLPAPCADLFVFIDAGSVAFSEFTLVKPAASAGVGLRVEIMPGVPLMVGMGWPFYPTEKLDGATINNAQNFFFAMGGFF